MNSTDTMMQAAICTAMGGFMTSPSSEDWDEKKILDTCIDTMRAKASAIAASSGGRKDANLVVDDKPIRVAITLDTDK